MIYLKTFKLSDVRNKNTNIHPYNIFRGKKPDVFVFENITVLYGNNGAGKSTILNLIAHKLNLKGKERVNLDDILSLDYYKLQKLGKDEKQGNDISLSYGDGELVGISENATSRIAENNEEYLDDIIQRINDMFGIGLTV